MLTTNIYTYYEKLGFNTIKRTVAHINLTEEKRCEGIRVFDYTKDINRITKIYNEFNKNRIGSIVRNKNYWDSQFEFCDEDKDLFLIYEQKGQLDGYIRCKKKSGFIEILEYGFKSSGRSVLTKLLENLAYLTRISEFELFLSKKDERLIDPRFRYSLRDETDFMVCYLDEKLSTKLKNKLMKDRNLNFWQSDFF
jgi:hypothetical protein